MFVASMGTALEMFSAYRAGVPVYAVRPMGANWVVRALSRRVRIWKVFWPRSGQRRYRR